MTIKGTAYLIAVLLLMPNIDLSAQRGNKKQQAKNSAVQLNSSQVKGVINKYSPVVGYSPCDNGLIVEDPTSFKAGDTVLIIQMKGAVIDSSNSSSFGTIIDYKNAGNYEFNYVQQVNGNVVALKNLMTRGYDIPTGRVQLIRVPYFNSVTVTDTLTCMPWNGRTGGVLAFNVKDTLILNADINVSGKGFGGGKAKNTFYNGTNCFANEYYYPASSIVAAPKGESIASIGNARSSGKGALASAGGGGLDHNSGGGGGGNASSGGMGGYPLYECNYSYFDSRGIGGKGLTYNNTINRIYLGGGGGAGHCNNGFVAPTQNTDYSGGNGGGIVIIRSRSIFGNDRSIISKGDSAYELNSLGGETHDGMGGGGSGGTILLSFDTVQNITRVKANGGKGGVMHASMLGGHVGPGGGGAGGVVWTSAPAMQPSLLIELFGGLNGYLLQENNNPYGATAGSTGVSLYNLKIPVDTVPFKRPIDSVRFSSNRSSCSVFQFNGIVYGNGNAARSWLWSFGDGATANTQNSSHTYSVPGNYLVKLIVTDANGCKDSISDIVTALAAPLITRTPDTIVCKNTLVQLFATGGDTYRWTPTSTLNDPNIANPIASPGNTTTTYYLTVSSGQNCTGRDSVKVTIASAPNFTIDPPTSTCNGTPKQLNATGGDTYLWSPAVGLSNNRISNPIADPDSSTTYSVMIRSLRCNDSAALSTRLIVYPNPTVKADKTNDIDCKNSSSQLMAKGASRYSWSPVNFLNDPTIANPISTASSNITYTVTGTDQNGCSGSSSVSIKVQLDNDQRYYLPNSFTPNGDGLNDRFCLKDWGTISNLQFSIFNRWGERVFYTEDPTKCWDGRFKGEPQQSGNFIYMVTAQSSCGAINMKGNVVLIR